MVKYVHVISCNLQAEKYAIKVEVNEDKKNENK